MFDQMIELFKQAHWSDIVIVLSQGEPPVALQLLFANLIFFLIYAFRRLRGKKTRPNNASYLVHGTLVLVNAAVLLQTEFAPFYQHSIVNFWHKFQNVI